MPEKVMTDEVLRELPAAEALRRSCLLYAEHFHDGDVFGALEQIMASIQALEMEIQIVMREPFHAQA